MFKTLVLSFITLPLFANAASDICSGGGYTVAIKGNLATVSGKLKVALSQEEASSTPEDKNSWPIFDSPDGGTIEMVYYNAVNPNSKVSKTKFTAQLSLADNSNVDLVCSRP